MKRLPLISFSIFVLALALVAWGAPRIFASTYYNLFLLNNTGLQTQNSAPIPPVISTSTRAMFSSTSTAERNAAYASSSAAIIAYFGKIGIKLSTDYPTTTPKVMISSLSKMTAAPGELISVYGKGFTKGINTVYFGDKKTEGIGGSLGTSMSIKVPQEAYGIVSLRVEAQGERSNAYPVTIVKAGAVAPKISVVQKSGNLGTKIVIKGTNITKINSVHTTLGTISNVKASDNVSLTFSFLDVPGLSFYKDVPSKYLASTSVMIWISNENGTSNVVGPLTLTLTQ
jgi:hypothetical protein